MNAMQPQVATKGEERARKVKKLNNENNKTSRRLKSYRQLKANPNNHQKVV